MRTISFVFRTITLESNSYSLLVIHSLRRVCGGLIILTSPIEVKYPVLDIILLIIVSIIVKYTFQSIGGFIRWIVFRKKSLKEYVNDHWEGNLAVFLLTTALVAVVIILVTI